MRILVFSTLFPNALEPQHGVFVKTRLLQFQKRHDAAIKVIAPIPFSPPVGPAHWQRYRDIPAVECIDGFEVHHPRFLALPGIGDGFRAKIMAASLKSFMTRAVRDFRPDILDVHYAYPEGVAAFRLRPALARALGRPLPMTLTCRGTDLNLWPDIKGAGEEIRAMLKGVDQVITVSDALREKALSLGCPESRAITLRNGVDADLFSPGSKTDAREKLGLPANARIALAVGNLVENKGQHLLIESLARLRQAQPEQNWHLALIGKGEEKARLASLTADLGLNEHVIMPGGQPAAVLPDWYRSADVMLLASSREGWPNVVLESFASGLPVIATPVGGVPEIFGTCPAGRLVERSADAFAEAIEESQSLDATKARPHAERHGWEATSDGMATLFTRLATTQKPTENTTPPQSAPQSLEITP